MTDQRKIETFATLSVRDIDDLRLMVSIASKSGFYASLTAEYWADILNKAAEQKQADQYTSFEELDDDNQMAFI